MVEVASKAKISYQDEMWVGRTPSGGGPVAWLQVLGIEQLAFPENTPEEVDVTHQQSPGRTRETIPGMLASADMTQEMQDWGDEPSQVLLDDLAKLTEAGAKEDILLEMKSGTRRRTYRAYVNSFVPSGTVGEKAMVSVGFKVFERLPTNPRTVTP